MAATFAVARAIGCRMMAYRPQHPHSIASAVEYQRDQSLLYSTGALARSLPLGGSALPALDVLGPYSAPTMICLPQLPDHLLLRSVADARIRAHHDIHRLFRLPVAQQALSVHTNPRGSVPAGTQGLDLLHQAISNPDAGSLPDEHPQKKAANGSEIDNKDSSHHFSRNVAEGSDLIEMHKSGTPRLYVTRILDTDVLCGRGGLSNHHPGNKRFRRVVNEMKKTYRKTEAKNLKTDLSRAIVEHVCGNGGRFIKKDEKKGRYHVLTKAEARRKTSQALRETKELKWTI